MGSLAYQNCHLPVWSGLPLFFGPSLPSVFRGPISEDTWDVPEEIVNQQEAALVSFSSYKNTDPILRTPPHDLIKIYFPRAPSPNTIA